MTLDGGVDIVFKSGRGSSDTLTQIPEINTDHGAFNEEENHELRYVTDRTDTQFIMFVSIAHDRAASWLYPR